MKFMREVHEQYQKAYALATRNQQKNKKQGLPICPVVLDSLINERMISYRLDLGVIEIPTSLIVGVAEENDKLALYTKEFLPVSKPNSDFANKWRQIYADFISNDCVCDEIRCLEYLGRFYVADGLKRVSVAKFHGAPILRSQVIRIMPIKTDSKEVELYYDFLFHFRLTRLYQLQFTQPGHFEKMQRAFGKTPTGKWSDSDRAAFLLYWPTIEKAFHKSYSDYLNITAADALVVLLDKYSYTQISRMEPWVLARVFQVSWKELYTLSFPGFSIHGKKSSEKLQTA